MLLHRDHTVSELQLRSQGKQLSLTHSAAASQQQHIAAPTRAWTQAACSANAREGPAAACQVRAGSVHPSQLPPSAPTDHNADAAATHAGQQDAHTGRAAAPGLWARSVKLAGQAVSEVAVATAVLPLVLPSLAVLHVPAGVWAGACLTRLACNNLFGF